MAQSKLDNHPYHVMVKGKLKRSKFLHFSFVVRGNTMLSWGWNHHGESPGGYDYGNTIHSEVHAYEKAKNFLKEDDKFEVLNLRFNKHGTLNMAAPCSCCINFLRVAGCKSVYFSTQSGIATMKVR